MYSNYLVQFVGALVRENVGDWLRKHITAHDTGQHCMLLSNQIFITSGMDGDNNGEMYVTELPSSLCVVSELDRLAAAK